jgi:hypothetical protein
MSAGYFRRPLEVALTTALQMTGRRKITSAALTRIETGNAESTITCPAPAQNIADHLLGVLVGVRVLARVRPDRTLLEGAIAPARPRLEGQQGTALRQSCVSR